MGVSRVILENINRIVEARKKSEKLTVSELARRMGYSQSHIGQVLKGQKGLGDHLIDGFCQALGIDFGQLAELDPLGLYANPEHDALHRRMQRLLDGGQAVAVERALAAVEHAALTGGKRWGPKPTR